MFRLTAIFMPPYPLIASANTLTSMYIIDANGQIGEAEAGTRGKVVPVTDFSKVIRQFTIN